MLRHIPAIAASLFIVATTAHAEIVSIPGAAFDVADADTATINGFPALVNGTLKPAGMARLVAPVDFPRNGQKICKMTIVYDDGSNEDLQMQLVKKPSVGGTNANNPPAVVATVSSSGNVAGTTRRASTKAIAPRKVNDTNGFYFVQTSFVNTNLNIIGVEFDVRSTCP